MVLNAPSALEDERERETMLATKELIALWVISCSYAPSI